MSAEIDRLEINIEASASSAAEKINSLADSLERIASSSSGIRDKLNNAADGFLNLKDSVKGMGDAVKSITKLNDALSNLSEITVPKGLKDLADVAKPLQSISDSIGNFSSTEDLQKTSVQLQALTQSLRTVSRVEIKNSDDLKNFVNNISSLQVDSDNLKNLSSLANAVSRITNAKVNEAAADSLRLFIDTVRILTDDDVVKLNALSDAASRLTKFKGIETPQIDADVSENIDRAGTSASRAMSEIRSFDQALFKLAGGSAKAAAQSIKLVFSPLTMAASKFQNAAVKAGQFLSSIKRIAMYRAIRSAIKAITEGFEEGRKNLYYYSQAVGTDFAPSMDKAATAAMYLKNSIGAATAPLTNYLVPMIDKAVDHIVELINKFNELTAVLTGAQTWTKARKYPVQWQDALDDTTKSAKKLKSTMLGFDELNVIEPISPAAKSAKFDMDDYAKMFTEMTTSQTWKNNLPDVLLPVKLAWDAQGDKTIQTIKDTWKEILGLLDAVRESFRTVWMNGTGQKTLELILEITQNIVGTFGALAKKIKEAWKEGDKGTRIVQSVWNVANNLLTVFRDIWGSIREWAENLNWNPLLESIEELTDAFDELTNPDGGAMTLLKGLWKDVLLPLGKWTIEEGVPVAISLFASAVNFLDAALDKIQPIAKKFWDEFLQPIAKWSGIAAIEDIKSLKSVIDDLTDTLNGKLSLSDFFSKLDPSSAEGRQKIESIITAFNPLMFNPFEKGKQKWLDEKLGLSDLFSGDNNTEYSLSAMVTPNSEDTASFFSIFKESWLDGISQIDSAIKESTLYHFFSDLTESAEQLGEDAYTLFNVTIPGAVDGFKNKVSDGWESLKKSTKTAWDNISGKVTGTWDSVKKSLSNGWDKLTGSVEQYKNDWSDSFDNISTNVSDKWQSIKGWLGDNLSWSALKGYVSDYSANFTQKFGDIKREAKEKFDDVKKNITDFFTDFSIMQKAAKFRDDILDFFRGIVGNDSNSGVLKIFTDLKNTVVGAFSGIGTDVSDAFSKIWEGIKSTVNNILGGIETMANSAIDGVIHIFNVLNGITGIAKSALEKSWGIELKEISVSFDYLSLPRLENGGMNISSGQLFLARESGAEIVGQYGGKSAVMNNEQIVRAVADGVYNAVLSAMSQTNGGTQVIENRIYLDRKEITSQIEQQQQSNGVSIYGEVMYS